MVFKCEFGAAYGTRGKHRIEIHGRTDGDFEGLFLRSLRILLPEAAISIPYNSVFSPYFDACGIYLGLL